MGSPSPAPSWPSAAFSSASRRRFVLALGAVVAATLVLAAGARGLGAAGARLFLPTSNADWIWAALPRGDSAPIAFYAARDFTLDRAPAAARLLAQADEEYVLYLNGKRVGSGLYAFGAPLDVYDVGPLLRAGGNRLLVELRSGRGWGGLIARLEDGEGRRIVDTDERWRVFRSRRPGLLRGIFPLGPGDGSEEAFVWGRPPVGRWGMPEPGPVRPWPAPPPENPAAVFGLLDATPVPAAAALRAPARAIFEWGQEVEGYLALTLSPHDAVGVGLLRTGDGTAERTAVLVVPGEREWVDARPRRFRRAEVLGIEGIVAARVLPAAGAAPLPGPPGGVLGLSAPPLRTPVEEKVRRELERVAGVAGRKDL